MEINEEKRQKFIEFAGKRVNNILHDIQVLEPMSRSNSYDFTKSLKKKKQKAQEKHFHLEQQKYLKMK